MKTQALRFTLILLSNLTLSTLTTVSVAQTQDYSRVNLPDGAIVRMGKGGVSLRGPRYRLFARRESSRCGN